MNLGLERKRALVLASSSGLGKAVALELAREGARVALCSRDRERVDAAAAAIREETGGQAKGYVVDVADDASLAKLIADAAGDMGGLDLLVCNAGGPPPGNFRALDADKWDRAYQLTLQSVVRSIRHALPHLEAGDDAAILAIASSTSSRRPASASTASRRAGSTPTGSTRSTVPRPNGRGRASTRCAAPASPPSPWGGSATPPSSAGWRRSCCRRRRRT